MHTFSNVNPGIESEPSLKYRFGRTGCINLRRVSSLVLGMLAAACISRHHDEGAVSSAGDSGLNVEVRTVMRAQ